MKYLLTSLAVSFCLVLPMSASAFEDGWGEPTPDPYEGLLGRL